MNQTSAIKFKWDGLLISTPAWSTGHSSSYGAPLLEHSSKDLIITAKWSNPCLKPNIIKWTSQVNIQNISRLYDLWINLDGQLVHKTKNWEEIDIEIQKSDHTVNLLIANEYLTTWDRKVMQQQGYLEH